ncbi:MAG: hypothetical protein IT495_10525 [Gammaproteobacteria bacterium]|nr:hypothetical protein [Gammaproteobacteria bacterium]
MLDSILSLAAFWTLALLPPSIARFKILKRPMGRLGAWTFVILAFFVNFTAQFIAGGLRQEFIGGGPPHPGMIGLFLMGWATFSILRYEKKVATDRTLEVEKEQMGKWHE